MWSSEQKFADLLTKQKREWQSPTQTFKLRNSTYRPDFYLPKEKLYIEVIASKMAYFRNNKKYKLFKKLYPHLNFITVDINNNPYPYKKSFMGKKIDLPSIKIFGVDYNKVKEISKVQDDKNYVKVISRAINNYWKSVIGNRLPTKK